MVSSQEILVGWDWETPEGATIFNEIGFFLINIVMFGVLYQELEPNECYYCLCQWYG